MNELARLQYLHALGVETFAPRWRLPGARPSSQVVLPVIRSVRPVQTEAPRAHSAPAPARQAIEATLAALPKAEPANLAPAAEPPPSIAQAAVPVRFTLNIWRVNTALMIIDSHAPRAALPTAALLSNMLLAKQWQGRLGAFDTLRWPLFKDDLAEAGLAQARDMVRAFLQSRLELSPVRFIWLMGADAFAAVAPEGIDYLAKVGSALELPALNCLGLILPSLAEQLQDAGKKPLAWAAIQPYPIDG